MNRLHPKASTLSSCETTLRRQTLLWMVLLGLGNAFAATPPQCPAQATGTVEIQWRGKGGPQLAAGETKYAFASLEAFPPSAPGGPRGQFIYSVFNPDLMLHRVIVVDLFAVATDPSLGQAWMAGVVVEDTKVCSGGHEGEGGSGEPSGGGHDDSCDDGCSDANHDPSAEELGGEGGNPAPGMPGEESGEASTTEGGCGGDDDGTTHDDGCAGGGSDAGGGKVSGKNSRVGQILLAKIKDYGTPGWQQDHITWKWFSAADPTIDDFLTGGNSVHLCRKTILGGNLVVHGWER